MGDRVKLTFIHHSCRIGAVQEAFGPLQDWLHHGARLLAQFLGLQPYLRHDPANDKAETTYFLTSAAPPAAERTNRSAQDAVIELFTTSRKRQRAAHVDDNAEQQELDDDDYDSDE